MAEEKFSLRDKIAIDILKELICNDPTVKENCAIYIKNPSFQERELDKVILKITKMSYKIADVVREERLKVFK